MGGCLFEEGELPERPEGKEQPPPGRPRLRLPVRDQMILRSASLDQLLPPEHEARLVWEAVSQLDVSPWLNEVKAVEGRTGRNATDPRVLLALWVYATLQGEGSARKLARLCEEHIAYQWLRGEVTLNYHTLADFRSQGGDKWDRLLSDLVASLMTEGLVTLHRVAQDGMRVRANAGKSSFRRKKSLEECQAEADEQVELLRRLAEENPDELTARQTAARERAARERQERIAAALAHRDELAAQREKRATAVGEKVQEARASTTDPEARNMKFANGGYGPGFNTQFSTDVESGLVVGVEVTNAGTDGDQLAPMLDQVAERCGRNPAEVLVDGGFATKDSITDATDNHACTIYAPLNSEQKQLDKGQDPYAPKRGDSPAVADWRQRMSTAAAKQTYRLRAQTAEWVNALCRNRGLQQMPVRGKSKCRIVALLYAITHNLMQAANLRAQRAVATQ